MAKKDIHPERQIVTVTMTDGTTYQTKMCLPEGKTELKLDIDPLKHPAWREDGQRQLLDTGGRVSRFAKKFGNIGVTAGQEK